MDESTSVTMQAIPGLPEIRAGDELGAVLADALMQADCVLRPGDILVVAHKVVSKAEGRVVCLDDVVPSAEAERLAAEVRKPAEKIELILRESQAILRIKPPRADREAVLICQHRSGLIMANAGIDESNVPGERMVVLLPEDADASARRLSAALRERFGVAPGVVISDTFGRPWRMGLVNVAIGLAGVPGLVDATGGLDAYGRPLRATVPAFADEVAAAAGLLMQKAAHTPAVLIRGLTWSASDAGLTPLLRPVEEDLFR